jgi:phosphoribosyl-ATP pyrophosphohydrolase/phosphoribosyl-AMP cyclohydrolase
MNQCSDSESRFILREFYIPNAVVCQDSTYTNSIFAGKLPWDILEPHANPKQTKGRTKMNPSALSQSYGLLPGQKTVARIEDVDFDKSPILPVIVQDVITGLVLTLAYMNREALARTLELRQTVFWSRSRQELWHKGATSGNYQDVVSIRVDCDGDALLLLVRPRGPACHTGATSCFYRTLEEK